MIGIGERNIERIAHHIYHAGGLRLANHGAAGDLDQGVVGFYKYGIDGACGAGLRL